MYNFIQCKNRVRTMTFGFGSVQFGFFHIFFYFRVQVRFLEKPEFCFGSFLLGSGSFPSLMFSFINSGISSAYKLAASAVCYNRLYSLRTTIRMSAAFHNNTPSHLCAHIRPRMPGARPRKYATDEKHERDSDRCI